MGRLYRLTGFQNIPAWLSRVPIILPLGDAEANQMLLQSHSRNAGPGGGSVGSVVGWDETNPVPWKSLDHR